MAVAVSMPLTACEDFFDLRPTNEMVLDEFWQTESDVLSVTGAAIAPCSSPDSCRG